MVGTIVGEYVLQVTPEESAVCYRAKVFLHEGTHKVRILYHKGPDLGKFRFRLQSGEEIYSPDVDGYSATGLYHQYYEWQAVVEETDLYWLFVETRGKNPLSSSYYVLVAGMSVARYL